MAACVDLSNTTYYLLIYLLEDQLQIFSLVPDSCFGIFFNTLLFMSKIPKIASLLSG